MSKMPKILKLIRLNRDGDSFLKTEWIGNLMFPKNVKGIIGMYLNVVGRI